MKRVYGGPTAEGVIGFLFMLNGYIVLGVAWVLIAIWDCWQHDQLADIQDRIDRLGK